MLSLAPSKMGRALERMARENKENVQGRNSSSKNCLFETNNQVVLRAPGVMEHQVYPVDKTAPP